MTKYYKIYVDGEYLCHFPDRQWAQDYLKGVVVKEHPTSKIEIREGKND